MSTTTTTRLIVMLAFVRDDEGELQPAFGPRSARSASLPQKQKKPQRLAEA